MQFELRLHVYDLWSRNWWLHPLGLGAYHSGVVLVAGGRPVVEITYGGHASAASGVFQHPPGFLPGGPPLRCAVELGPLPMSHHEFARVVEGLATQWRGCDYELLRANCNHFTNALVLRLLGRPAPSWINRLAAVGAAVECAVPINRLLGMPPPSAESATSNDLEQQWGDSAHRLSDASAPALESEDERRQLLADAAAARAKTL